MTDEAVSTAASGARILGARMNSRQTAGQTTVLSSFSLTRTASCQPGTDQQEKADGGHFSPSVSARFASSGLTGTGRYEAEDRILAKVLKTTRAHACQQADMN